MQESVDDVVVQVLFGGLCWPESIHVSRPDHHCGTSWLRPFVDVPCRLFRGQHVSRHLLLFCGEGEVRMGDGLVGYRHGSGLLGCVQVDVGIGVCWGWPWPCVVRPLC